MKKNSDFVILGIVTLFGLYLCSLYSYLLFHSIAELFSIVIACGIFVIAWNSRNFFRNDYLLFVGIAYLFVAGLDLVHTLAYGGMGIFLEYTTNLPTQLWIGSRYLESLSLLLAPVFFKKKLNVKFVFLFYLVVFWVLLLSIFKWDLFPDCFQEGIGLTTFKIASEYIISLILILSMVLIYRNRTFFEPQVLQWVLIAIFLTIVSELMFTLYISSHGLSNFLGHYFKIGSFYFMYKAIIETGLSKPYDLMFRELKQSQERYRSLFTHMINGFAFHRIVLDDSGKPVDYVFLEVNDAFEAQTGLDKETVAGKRATEVLPGIENDPADWIGVFGKVALSGQPTRFENYSEKLGRWYSVLAFSPRKKYFVVLFEDITRKKQMEDELVRARDELENRVRQRTFELENAYGKLQRSERQLRILSAKLLSAQEKERKRIAGEIHDSLGSSLTAIKFSLEHLLCRAGDDPKLTAPIQTLLKMTRQAIDEARKLILDLRPAMLDDLGLIPTIQWFCERFESIYSGIRVSRQISIKENQVPTELKIVIFRIMQEAFNNIAKYSGAENVELYFGMDDDLLVLSIEDNGAGFDMNEVLSRELKMTGLGLSSMKERAELTQGKLAIDTSPGKGTRVRAAWPAVSEPPEQKKAV